VDDLGQSVQVVATDGHPFYVVDVGWTTADAIQVGQKLVGAGGAVLTVVANRDWKPDGGVVVYNFQVEGDHTYFVGDIHAQGEWVWTHNACVYQAKGGDGKIIYVGITDDFTARAASHLREKSIVIAKIRGLTDLPRDDARAVEQALIELHRLGRNGGSLLNKINSISSKNPIFNQARSRAMTILKSLGQVS
jgi:predicted GIY-YIG superfamily endonuclease